MKERRISNWIITIHAEALLVISLPAANFERIKSFGFADRVEQTPEAGLVQGADGWLYGTSAGAGTAQNAGTMFKVQPDGSSYAILYRFHMGNGDGQTPEAALIQASDGAL